VEEVMEKRLYPSWAFDMVDRFLLDNQTWFVNPENGRINIQDACKTFCQKNRIPVTPEIQQDFADAVRRLSQEKRFTHLR
jgi:hypothetical protein